MPVQPYTRVPNAFLDELMSSLSGATLKTFLYLFRRTAGFQKATDAVSLSQLSGGIRRADGTLLDNGTGLCRQSVIAAVQALESRDFIKVERRKTVYGDYDTNRYTINPELCARPHDFKNKKSEQPVENTAVVPAVTERKKSASPPPPSSSQPTSSNQPSRSKADNSRSDQPRESEPARADDPLLQAILATGLSRVVADELLRSFSAADIAMQLDYLPHRKATNPAALFTVALRKGWPAPEGWVRAQKRTELDRQRRESEAAKSDRQKAEDERSFQLTVFIGLLSSRQQNQLQVEATQLLYEEAPVWRTRPIPTTLLEAYKRQVAEEWQRSGIETDFSDDEFEDLAGP